MAWRSTPLNQAGNSTFIWNFSGGPLTTHDVVVVGPEAGTSFVEIERLRVRQGPPRYTIQVRVDGAAAVRYRFYAEQIN